MSNSGGTAGGSLGQRVRGMWSSGRGSAAAKGESDRSVLVEPALVLAAGLALALYNQTASEVSGLLRIPALLAGLILAGQGFNDLRAQWAQLKAPREQGSSPAGASDTQDLKIGGSGEPTVNRGVDPEAADDGGAGSLPWLVIGLSVWLGLATLGSPTAPPLLIILSLLAAFLLFSKAWGVVAAERERRSSSSS